MTTITIIRHGQSVANLNKVFAGHFDVDLSDMGHMQAKLTAKEIASKFKIDKIYASDLKRAYNTALPLAELLGLEIIPDEGLREIYAGEWEGRTFDELASVYAHDYTVWRTDIGNSRCTGGESARELGERMQAKIREIAKENEGKTVVVATHAAAIRSLMAICSERGFDGMKDIPFVSNASYSVIKAENDELIFTETSLDAHLGEFKTKLPPKV